MSIRDEALDAARAVERVLRAERDAGARIEAAGEATQALRARAREEAFAIVNDAMTRVAGWERRHAATLEARVRDLRVRADTAGGPSGAVASEAALAAAAAALAARLTGADRQPPDGPAPAPPAPPATEAPP